MSIVSIERRLAKIEAARVRPDPAPKAMADDDLADALSDASDDPGARALADCSQAVNHVPLPAIAFEATMRSL